MKIKLSTIRKIRKQSASKIVNEYELNELTDELENINDNLCHDEQYVIYNNYQKLFSVLYANSFIENMGPSFYKFIGESEHLNNVDHYDLSDDIDTLADLFLNQ